MRGGSQTSEGGSSFSQFADSAADTFDSSYTSEFSDSFDSETSYDLPYGYAPDGTGIEAIQYRRGPIDIRAHEGAQLVDNPQNPTDLKIITNHTIGEHVGKSDQYLLDAVREQQQNLLNNRNSIHSRNDGFRKGSFSSVEAVNKIVNSALNQDREKVSLVAAGILERGTIKVEFSSPTGKEAYAPTIYSQAYIRDTYGVIVFIKHSSYSPNGFWVHTAYPSRRY